MDKIASKASFVDVFTNKPFLILWINQILLQVTYNVLNVSLIILVFRLTNSNTASAAFLLTAMLPILLFGVFAGVVADRFDKKKILLLTDIGIGILMLLFIPAVPNVALILAAAFALNVVFQFFIPTEAATLPSLVPKKDLMAANSVFQFTPVAALITGASIAGPIVSHFGYNPIFITGSLAMFATFFIRRFLPDLAPESHLAFNRKTEGFFRFIKLSKNHMAEGFKFILSDKRIWIAIAILSFIQASFFTVAVLAPGFMEQVLLIEATDASLILLLPLGVGAVVGALVTVKFGQKSPHRHLIIRGFILCGLALVLMALVPVIGQLILHEEFLASAIRPFSKAFTVSGWVSFFAFLLGIGAAHVIIPAQTTLQLNTRSDVRGRVFSVWGMLTSAGVSVPSLAAGVFADLFGVVKVLLVVGILVLVVGFFGFRAEKFFSGFYLKKRRLR